MKYYCSWDDSSLDDIPCLRRRGSLIWPSARRFALVIAGGVLLVLIAGGLQYWIENWPLNRLHLDGRPNDPAWVDRENIVAKQIPVLLASKPTLDKKPPHPISDVESNARPDQSKIQIAEDHRIYDLRDWKIVGPKDGPHTAAVTMTRKLRLTKTAPIERLDFLGRTSGADLVMRCESPNPEKALLFRSLTKPKVEEREMTEHRLSIDVSDIPVDKEFSLVTRTTFWNSLQAPDEQWFGTIGSDGSKLLSMLILFPADRPFAGGELQSVQPDGQRVPYDGTQLVFKGPGGSWVYWEVPGPKTGYAYRIDWKW